MKRIRFFTRADCHLCHAALFVVRRVRETIPFELEVVDIDAPDQTRSRAAFGDHIPVLEVDGREFCRHRVSEGGLRRRLLEG